MKETSRQIAERATFQSFANCYLREVDGGMPVRHVGASGPAVECIEWMLARQHLVMRAEVISRSRCGPHRFGRVWVRGTLEASWRPLELIPAMHHLIYEAYRTGGESGQVERLRSCELELLLRVLQSWQQTVLYLDAGPLAPPDEDSFFEAEQSLVFGHWMHPTPKSRQGMAFWQERSYAPELRGSFRLHYFAAPAERIQHASASGISAPDIVRSLVRTELDRLAPSGDEVLIPMHPLQAEALLLDLEVQALQADGLLRHLGPAGPAFTATSSVRTVYSPDQDWMLKFSLPVRITNSVRLNRRWELDAGVAMAKLIERAGISERLPRLRIVRDPAYVTLDMPGRAESGFEVILRENPFAAGRDRGVVTVAALTADPKRGEPSRLQRILLRLARREGAAIGGVSRAWFQRYLDHALDPLVTLYDAFGIALEAHQQNSLLDIGDGYPSACYYRDNQGFYLSNRHRDFLARHVPETEHIPSLYFDDAEIQDRFAYYLIVNQIFSVISRMGHDGLADEDALLDMLRERLERLARSMTGAGRGFARNVLDRPTIAAKANLTARLFDIDELQAADIGPIYRHLANPLATSAIGSLTGGGHAIAS
jgi:spermidine-citrate ligase